MHGQSLVSDVQIANALATFSTSKTLIFSEDTCNRLKRRAKTLGYPEAISEMKTS